jgi:hypothetical protein
MPQFPAPEEVRAYVRGDGLYFVPRWQKLTAKNVLACLRHNATNYEALSRTRRWKHEALRKEVNRLILERIGDVWKGGE